MDEAGGSPVAPIGSTVVPIDQLRRTAVLSALAFETIYDLQPIEAPSPIQAIVSLPSSISPTIKINGPNQLPI